MINLTWKFSFWVFERCSLLIWLSILLVLYIYFNWGQSFCGQNLSKKQEWSLRLKRFQAKCWNLEAVTYFYSILCVFLCPFYLLCVCVCVYVHSILCVCLRPFTVKASSVGNSWNVWEPIKDVALKTFLLSAKSLHRYFRMKHQNFPLATLSCSHTRSGQNHVLASARLAFKS